MSGGTNLYTKIKVIVDIQYLIDVYLID